MIVYGGGTFTMSGDAKITGNTSANNGGGVYVGYKSKFTMTGGTIGGLETADANSAGGDGGGVYVEKKINDANDDASFTMTGGSIIGNKAFRGGGVFSMYGTFKMSGNAEIADNQVNSAGGGVFIFVGIFIMDGGEIRANVVQGANGGYGSGGGVYVCGSTFTMNDGTISANKVTANVSGTGGGIIVTTGGAFEMNSGTISDNEAMDGGGVYVENGTFTMNGSASLNDNYATQSGGGVYIDSNGVFRMEGSSNSTANASNNNIDSNGGGKGGCVYVGGTFEIASNVQIWNSSSSDVYLPDRKTILITGKVAGLIGVTPENLPTDGNPVAFASGDTDYQLEDSDAAMFFVNDHFGDDKYTVQRDGNTFKLYLGDPHKHKICIGADCTDESHDTVFFDALTYDATQKKLKYSGKSIDATSGYYDISSDACLSLTDNLELDAPIRILADVKLCLNGYNIKLMANGDVITIGENGKLTLCDCKRDGAEYGEITHGTVDASSQYTGRGVTISSGQASFTMYGGRITGNTLTENNSTGAGVYVGSGSSFNMLGGEISGNALTRWYGKGGGVYASGTTLIGGNAKISENQVSGGTSNGGGVYVDSNQKLTLSGNAQITNNKAYNFGGGIYMYDGAELYVSDNVQVTGNQDGYYDSQGGSNVYLKSTVVPISVRGQLDNSARIGVSLPESIRPTDDNPKLIAQIASDAGESGTGWIQTGNFVSDYSVLYKMTVSSDGTTATLELHDHIWEILKGSDENALRERCTVKGCNVTGGTLTLTATDEYYTGEAYAGANLEKTDWSSTIPEIKYEQKNSDSSFTFLDKAPVAWGNYRASITVDNVIATKEFSIKPHTLIPSDFTFTAPDNLTYDGQPKTATVTLPEAKANAAGEITVRYYDKDHNLITDASGNAANGVTEAGTYTVEIDVTVGEGYRGDSFSDSAWTFTINQAPQNLSFENPAMGKTYGDAVFTNALAATSTYVGAITYASDNEEVATVDSTGKVTIVGAGTATITATAAAMPNYAKGTASYELTVAEKELTITGLSAASKTYDGNASATITGTAEIIGLVNGDAVTVTPGTANFDNKNVGENKTVTFTGYALVGAKAGNYTLAAQPQSVTANITPATITVTPVAGQSKIYGEADVALNYDVAGAASGETPVFDGALARAEGENVGTYAIEQGSLKLKDGGNFTAGNYTLAFDTTKVFTINKAIYGNKTADGSARYGNPGTVDLSSLIADGGTAALGTVTDNDSVLDRTPTIDGKTLSFAFKDEADNTAKTATIVINVTGAPNYEDYTITVTVKVENKIVPTGQPVLGPDEITYGDALGRIELSGMLKDGEKDVPGTFQWADETIEPEVGNGTYNASWKFTPDDARTYATVTGIVAVKVNRAAQSGTVSMKSYTYNGTPGAPGLTERTGDSSAAVTYYYSMSNANKDGTEWKDITSTTLDAGTYYMYAVIGETANYRAFTTQAVEFVVGKASWDYKKPAAVTAKCGQKLGEIELTNPAENMSGTWSWQAPETVLGESGALTFYADFKPDDTNYLEVANAAIEVRVEQGDGKDLGTVELTQKFNDSSDCTYTPDWSGLPAGQTWSYDCASSVSSGSAAKLTKLEVSAENGGLTYAVSGGKVGDIITVTLKASCKNYKEFTITLNITITKATPTGEPNYTKITTDGKTLADAALTLTGSTLSPAAGTLEWLDAEGNVLSADTKVEANKTYTWRFTPDDDNYDILTGGMELYHVDLPAISAQPKDASVKAGEKAVFEVTATGTGLTYQWQIDRNDGKGFVAIDGAIGASYTSGVTDMGCNGFKYQCVISNAAGSVTTDTVTLTVTEEAPPAPKYEIIEGANSSWTQSVDGGLAIRGNGEFADFQKVLVDGNVVDPENYIVTEGSTIITLKPEFLSTLSEGSHTFEIVWTNGSAATSLTVAKNSSGGNGGNGNSGNNNNGSGNSGNSNNGNSNNSNAGSSDSAADTTVADKTVIAPKTGDASKDALLAVLVVVSFAGLAGMLVLKKKNAYK